MASQLVINAVISSSLIFMLAAGFALIYHVTGCLHFAHAGVFTSGAYSAFLFHSLLGIPTLASALLGIAFAALLGSSIELAIYRPMRRKGCSSITVLLASLGMYVVLQNLLSLCFGDDIKTIRSGAVKEGISILGGRATPAQIAAALAAVVVLIASTVLAKTTLGKSMRAVADDPALAEVCGIMPDRTRLWTFALASALAGMVGILAALDADMSPTMGMDPLMVALAAVIVGGVRSTPGIALGALLLGVAQQFGAWGMGSQWRDAITFAILLAFLLFRPRGFMGKKARTATV